MPALTDVKYTQTFTSEAGVIWKIDLIDKSKNLVEEPLTFNSDSNGFTLTYIGQGDERWEPIKASRVSINFLVENSTALAFILSFASNDETRFLCKIYKDNVFYWGGILLSDLIEYEDKAYPFYVNLQYACGLGRLANLPFVKADGSNYTYGNTLNEIITDILNKTGTELLWDNDDVFLLTTIDWIEYNQSNIGIQRLDLLKIKQETFYEQGTGNKIPYDCLTVLRNILICFFARIYHAEGKWIIDQVNEVTKDNYYNTWLKTGEYITQGTNSRSFANTNFKRSEGLFTYFRPLRSASSKYIYKTGLGDNFLPYLSSYELELYIGRIYGSLTGVRPVLRFRGTLIHSLQGTGTPDDFRAVFKLRLKLTNIATGASIYLYNGAAGDDPLSWSSSPKYVTLFSSLKSGSGWFSIDTFWDIISPSFSYEHEMTFQFTFLKFVDENYVDYTMPAGLTYTWEPNGFSIVAYDPASPQNNVNGEQIFKAYQLDGAAITNKLTSHVDIEDIEMGDGPLPFNTGAISVANISTPTIFEPAVKWYYGSINENGFNIAKLRLYEFMIGQLNPVLIFRGVLKHITTSLLQVHNFTLIDTHKMIVNGLELRAGSDEMSVELFECDVDRSDYSKLTIDSESITGKDSEFTDTFEYNFDFETG